MDHEGRLMPFIICGLIDECPSVQALTLQQLDAIGIYRRAVSIGARYL